MDRLLHIKVTFVIIIKDITLFFTLIILKLIKIDLLILLKFI